MRKFVRTYSPFLVYFVCVALAYFLCFYLFPKYNAALAEGVKILVSMESKSL